MGFLKRRMGLEPDDLSAYAEARGLTFRGDAITLLGARVASTSGDKFNVMHGRVPGDERGLLGHVLRRYSESTGHGASHQPTTVAAFPLSEAIGTLMRVLAVPGGRAEEHAYMRAAAPDPLPRHGTVIAPEGDDAVLAAAIGEAAAELGSTEVHFGMGCLWLVRQGYARDEELDAFSRLGAGIVRRAREASLAKLPPADFMTELPAPRWFGSSFGSATEQMQAALAHGIDAPLLPPLDDWVPDVAAHRGWAAEDVLAFHRAFAGAALRGQALAVFRASMRGRAGRLVVAFDVRPPEAWGADYAVLPVPEGVPPTRPGDVEKSSAGGLVGVGGGVLTYGRVRTGSAVDGRALVRLGEEAAFYAERRGW